MKMSMKNWMRLTPLVMFATLGMMAGCASAPSSPVAMSTEPAAHKAAHAECLVCKKNADMACVDVDLDAKTPFTDYNGKRYYFCSDDCRSEFQKDPAKFAKAK
jgi:YHS domain-containing protein